MKINPQSVRRGHSLMCVIFLLLAGGCPSTNTCPPARIRSLPSDTHTGSKHQAQAARPRTTLSSAKHSWTPSADLEEKSRWQGIIVHHSATRSGSAAMIDQMHKQKGWDGMGYDFVINNGRGAPNGQVEVGWRWVDQREGAHCRVDQNDDNYWNEHTIGICLVGNFENERPTAAQYDSLARLVRFLMARYHIPWSRVKGHGEVDQTQCPGRNFSMAELKKRLKR